MIFCVMLTSLLNTFNYTFVIFMFGEYEFQPNLDPYQAGRWSILTESEILLVETPFGLWIYKNIIVAVFSDT